MTRPWRRFLWGMAVLTLSAGSTACMGMEEDLQSNQQAAKVPDYFNYGKLWEYDVLIKKGNKKYDGDFQDGEFITDGQRGTFDGPGPFNGKYEATKNSAGTQTLKVNASGGGNSMDVTVTVDSQGNATLNGTANDQTFDNQSVTITGDGSAKNPFCIKLGGITFCWDTECKEISALAPDLVGYHWQEPPQNPYCAVDPDRREDGCVWRNNDPEHGPGDCTHRCESYPALDRDDPLLSGPDDDPGPFFLYQGELVPSCPDLPGYPACRLVEGDPPPDTP